VEPKYNSQSSVESSQNEKRYLAIVLLMTFSWLLHCGWCDDVVRGDGPSWVKSSFLTLAQNSVP
jgi:hypothetical protein